MEALNNVGSIVESEVVAGESESFVSIITPVYNSEAYLDEAIASACAQTHSNFEYFLVDDGSCDRSVDIINTWAKRDSRITPIYRTQNGGPAAARNSALEVAEGKFIAFLDSDDVWGKSKLEKQLAFLKRHSEVGLVASEINRIDNFGTVVERKIFDVNSYSWGWVSAKDYIIKGLPLCTSSIIVRTEYLRKQGGFRALYRIGEDYEMWFRISRECEIRCIAEPLVNYRQHDTNTTGNKLRNRRNKVLLLENEVLNNPRVLNEIGDEFIGMMQRKYCSLAKLYAENNDMEAAKKTFEKALAFDSSRLQRLKAYILRWWYCFR